MLKGNLSILFNKIDTFIFSKLEQVQGANAYNQYRNFLKDHLDENIQKMINISLTFLLIFLPVIITIGFLVVNTGQKSELQRFQDINQSISSITNKSSALAKTRTRLGQVAALSTKEKLRQKIQATLHKYNAASTKIDSISFKLSSTKQLQKVTASISLKNISTEGMLNFSKELINRYKMAFKTINIKRNNTNESLRVSFGIEYFVAQ